MVSLGFVVIVLLVGILCLKALYFRKCPECGCHSVFTEERSGQNYPVYYYDHQKCRKCGWNENVVR